MKRTHPGSRSILCAILVVGGYATLAGRIFSPPPVRGQAKTPSIGKITYKPALTSGVRTARVVGALVAARGKAVLLIVTKPEGAMISINGQPKGASNSEGTYREEVATNKEYKIVVTAEKHLPFTDTVMVASSEPQLVSATLTPTFGALRLFNVPADASVLIDERKTEYQFQPGSHDVVIAEVSVGSRQLKIAHPDYVDWEKSVDVVPGFELGVSPELVPASTVRISSVPGVDVLLDDVKQGVTSAAGALAIRTPLQPGKHQLALSKSGSVTHTQVVNLARGENMIEVPEIEPVPSYSEFADFFNDGMDRLQTPSTWQWVRGQAAITVQGPGIGVVKERSFRDFDFVFDVKFTNNLGAAWILRARNSQNYYLFQLSIREKLLHTYVVENGRVTAREPGNVLVDPGQNTSYQIRGEVQGDHIRHYLKNNTSSDEELMGILVDGRFRYGTVGFATVAGEQFLVEDLIVKPYPDSGAKQ